MPAITLPADTKITCAADVSFVVQDGRLSPTGDIHYPLFYLQPSDPCVSDALRQWREANPYENAKLFRGAGGLGEPDRWPFDVAASGLQFDPAWAAFVPLTRSDYSSSHGVDHPKQVLEMFSAGDLHWDMRCSTIRPHDSLVGMCMYAVGVANGALPGTTPVSSPVSASLVLRGLKKLAIPAQQLREFTDGGLSLLDIATRYQCWEVAQWLWNKGVRFSAGAIADGHPLLDLVVAYENCAKAVHGFSSPNYILQTRLPSSEWFTRWLDRWEQSGGQVPTQPRLDWARRELDTRGFSAYPGENFELITPQQQFASRAAPVFPGRQVLAFDRAPAEHIASLRVWVNLFARHGVDILNLDFRQVLGTDKPKTMAMLLDEVKPSQAAPWKEMIAAQISEAGLRESTHAAQPSIVPTPRL